MSLNPEIPTEADHVWLASLRAAGRSPHTLRNYTYAVRQLRQWRSARLVHCHTSGIGAASAQRKTGESD